MTKTAVDLLLQAMETRVGKVQVSTLRQVAPRAADKLLEARLLVATGRIPVVAANQIAGPSRWVMATCRNWRSWCSFQQRCSGATP